MKRPFEMRTTDDPLGPFREVGESREQTLARLTELVARENALALAAALETSDGLDMFLRAETILGGALPAERWMTAPAVCLGGRRPIELLSTEADRMALADFLMRLDRGVYA